MLPNVDPNDGYEAGRSCERILVGTGGDLEGARGRVVTEPTPTGTLDGDGLGGHLGFLRRRGGGLVLDVDIDVGVLAY